MNISFDDGFSKRLGIDNRLCPPNRSISFWGLVALAAIVLFADVQAAPTFFALGDYVLWALSILVIVSAAGFYTIARIRIAQLSVLAGMDQEAGQSKRLLGVVSYALTVVTGLVFASVLLAVLMMRGR